MADATTVVHMRVGDSERIGKGTASAGWRDRMGRGGKCATLERDKCGRTNWW